MDSLAEAARASGSDALVVLRDGAVAFEQYGTPDGASRRFNIQSVSKPLVALTLGVLTGDRTVRSLDQPLGDFFPEWRDGARGQVTLRMLLNHTSGVAAERGEGQFFRRGDALAWARAQPLAEPPGARYRYNNVGVFLVANAAAQAAGQPFGEVAAERLLAPLCIEGAGWGTDRTGHTLGFGGLFLRGRDLARVGQLVLDRGKFAGRQLVRAAYVDSITRRGGGQSEAPLFAPAMGASWFVSAAWDSSAVDSASAVTMGVPAFAGRRVPTVDLRLAVARAAGLPDASGANYDSLGARLVAGPRPPRFSGPATSIFHDGSQGQYLTVYPSSRLVLVRLRRSSHRGERRQFSFDEYYRYAAALHRAVINADRGRGPAGP